MKEDEARTKFCPYMLSLSIAAAEAGREHQPLCGASDCMMWESWEYTDRNELIVSLDEGDCGLKSKDLHCNG